MSGRDAWVVATFCEINKFKSRTVDPAQAPNEVFELYSVPVFPSGRPELQPGRAIGSTKQVVQPGDVLVCKINPRINRVWSVTKPSHLRQIASSEWIVMRPMGLSSAYLRYYFMSQEFRERICDEVTGVGGSLTRAQPKRVATFPVPLAPFNEQERIAKKLDAVLARVDSCRERLDRVPELLKRLRESILTAGTSGLLTSDWTGHAEFTRMPLREVAIWSSGGTPSRSNPAYFSGGVAWVKTGELRENLILQTEESLTRSGLENSSAKLYPPETVLVAMYGATIGRVGILGIEAATNQACAAAVAHPNVMRPQYLFYLLQAHKAALVAKGQGGAQPNISQGLIKDHVVDVPTLPEQDEIVRRIEALLASADRLQTRYDNAQKEIDSLSRRLLAAAFRGELVRQDPNDEPAALLLERVRSR